MSSSTDTITNTDLRTATAHSIYAEYEEGVFLVPKTTRSGGTTSLLVESLNRNESVLVFVPTNKIADQTIVSEVGKHSSAKNPNIIHIPSNKSCFLNQDLCKLYPDLEKLPMLPIGGNCDICSYNSKCSVTKILRNKNCDGIVLTYHKIAALMMASLSRPNTMAEKILSKISVIKNIVCDESHELQYGKSVSITVYDTSKNDKWIDPDIYEPLNNDFKQLSKVVLQFKQLLDDPTFLNTTHELLNAAHDTNPWDKHLSRKLKNNYCDISLNDQSDGIKAFSAAHAEIIELTKQRKKYNLSMRDILDLSTMLTIVTNDKLAVRSMSSKGSVKVQIVSVDHNFLKMIQLYLSSLQNKNKRIFLTSATICSYDHSQLFLSETRLTNILFGDGGDPMGTNAKMLILADSKRLHSNGDRSIQNNKDQILDMITTILDNWGDENCTIITLSRTLAQKFEKNLDDRGHPHSVTYYKAPEMMGVTSASRIMIAIGAAQKPSNSYDVITDTQSASKILREESMHADTWQAWSRAKDPSAQTPSVVFAIGCSEDECQNIVTWGVDRHVEIEPYSNGKRKQVNVICDGQTISKPQIKKCSKFKDMLLEAGKHTHNKKVVSDFAPKPLIYNYISGFKSITDTVYSKRQLFNHLINRNDAYAIKNIDGSYSKHSAMIDSDLLDDHINGNINVATYALNPANEVKWICFDISVQLEPIDNDAIIFEKIQKAEIDKDTLCNYLTSYSIPFLLEASNIPHSYKIWIILKSIKPNNAKKFGKMIIKDCKLNCAIYPKQCTMKRSNRGDFVDLPFGTCHENTTTSKIWINGKFVDDFDELDVGILDISL